MPKLVQVSHSLSGTATADVIFVHGVQGDPRKTWTNDRGGFWPSWLAEDNPQLAVWSVGYDAAVSGWVGNAMPLFERANNVLAELQAAEIGNRPICWVTHSMGGLLVKQMLRNSDSLAAEFKTFSTVTRGVAFIGTPHTGSDLAGIARYLGFILKLSVAARELQALSSPLLELNAWYRENHRRLDITTLVFFENQDTKGVRVVDRGAADPGLEGVTPIGLDADHVSMCKPLCRDDLIYRRTMAFILQVTAAQADNRSGIPSVPRTAPVPDVAPRGKLAEPITGGVAEAPAFAQELERRLGSLLAPPRAADLAGLSAGRIRLLLQTAMATQQLEDDLAGMAHVVAMSGDFVATSVRLQRSLSRAKGQLLTLEGHISVGVWPHKQWAMKFITVQAEALREVQAAEARRYRATAFGRLRTDERDVQLSKSITKLHQLLEKQYPSLFTPRP